MNLILLNDRIASFKVTNYTDLFQTIEDKYLASSVGIDIPDYISSGGKSDSLKNLSDKMKAMGRRKRRK